MKNRINDLPLGWLKHKQTKFYSPFTFPGTEAVCTTCPTIVLFYSLINYRKTCKIEHTIIPSPFSKVGDSPDPSSSLIKVYTVFCSLAKIWLVRLSHNYINKLFFSIYCIRTGPVILSSYTLWRKNQETYQTCDVGAVESLAMKEPTFVYLWSVIQPSPTVYCPFLYRRTHSSYSTHFPVFNTASVRCQEYVFISIWLLREILLF